MSECLTELDLFQEMFQPFGKNVMGKWDEWLCDWDLFQETTSTGMSGMNDCVIGVIYQCIFNHFKSSNSFVLFLSFIVAFYWIIIFYGMV